MRHLLLLLLPMITGSAMAVCDQPDASDVVSVSDQTLLVDGHLSYPCNYSGFAGNKYISKITNKECQKVLNTTHPKNGRFSMKDQQDNKTLTIAIWHLKVEDTGMYFCYTQSDNGTQTIHNKLHLTVDSPLPRVTVMVLSFAGVLMVLLVSLLVAWKCLSSRNTTEGHKQEELHIYEEIQQHPLSPNSATADSSIYVTATHPSTTFDYSTIAFKAGGDEPCVIATPAPPDD